MHHVLFLVVPTLLTVFQGQQVSICRDWQDCRQLALDASVRGEYERFHDLAWRAVQTGPRNDAALMYLLARAQALSGRPHDALVMLQRLAGMGVAINAATDADFERVSALPGWQEVAAAIPRAGTAPSSASAVPVQAPPPDAVDSPRQPGRGRPSARSANPAKASPPQASSSPAVAPAVVSPAVSPRLSPRSPS